MNREELHPLLRRALLFLESGDIASADDYCEKYLDIEPEGAYAYVIKLMIRVGVVREEELTTAKKSFREWNSFTNAYRFADPDLRERLGQYMIEVEERIIRENEERIAKEKEEAMLRQYRQAVTDQEYSTVYRVETAMRTFLSMPDYRDCAVRAEQCRAKIAQIEQERAHAYAEEQRKAKKSKLTKVIVTLVVIFVIVLIIVFWCSSVNAANQKRIPEIEEKMAGSYTTSYFEGETYNGGGAITTYVTQQDYSVNYVFKKGGVGTVDTTVRYDEEPFLTYDGVRQWDSIDHYSRDFTWGDINISLSGKATVTIEGKQCELILDSENRPIQIKIDGKTYSAQ